MTALPSGVTASPLLDEYWKFAAERHSVFLKKLRGETAPWTESPIIQTYKFTNCFRSIDAVSQYLLREVIYSPGWETRSVEETIFRVLLFKIFNKNSTWDLWNFALAGGQGPSLANFDVNVYDIILSQAQKEGKTIWSGAYMLTAQGSFGVRRHLMYLNLLKKWVDEKVPERCVAGSMKECFDILMKYRTMKDFLSNQYTLDIGYTRFVDWDENDFVAAGPGTIRGFNKMFSGIKKNQYADIAKYLVDTQEEHFARLGLEPVKLGDRSLHLNDITNCGCEFDKFSRVAFPSASGGNNAVVRARIKQKYRANSGSRPALVFPPKWGIIL